MAIQTSTLRPGLLVSLKTSLVGNVSYATRDLEHEKKGGVDRARWETERTVADVEEFDAGKVARMNARGAITRVCASSAFGLLCPEDRSEELEEALVEARAIADVFNRKAKLTRLKVYVITGRIAPDDVEAVRAINSEVRDLLADMTTGLKNLDVKSVRDAANRARNIGSMLSPDAKARIQLAIEAARGAARKIVASGEQVSQEIDRRAIRAITESRTAFLDLDPAEEVAAPKAQARSVDLAPAGEVKKAPRARRAALEVE